MGWRAVLDTSQKRWIYCPYRESKNDPRTSSPKPTHCPVYAFLVKLMTQAVSRQSVKSVTLVTILEVGGVANKNGSTMYHGNPLSGWDLLLRAERMSALVCTAVQSVICKLLQQHFQPSLYSGVHVFGSSAEDSRRACLLPLVWHRTTNMDRVTITTIEL